MSGRTLRHNVREDGWYALQNHSLGLGFGLAWPLEKCFPMSGAGRNFANNEALRTQDDQSLSNGRETGAEVRRQLARHEATSFGQDALQGPSPNFVCSETG